MEAKKNNPMHDILTDAVKKIRRVFKDEAFKDAYEAKCREEIEKLLKQINSLNRKLGNLSYKMENSERTEGGAGKNDKGCLDKLR